MRPVIIGLTLALVGATWPVWKWVIQGTLDASNEPWGWLPAVLAALLALRHSHNLATDRLLITPAVLLTLYMLAIALDLPMAIRGSLGCLALASWASGLRTGRPWHVGLWTLCWLSLPLSASMQFYLGYPMRYLTCAGAATWLQWQGLPVMQDGSLLLWQTRQIAIDAPCSGVKMLWAGWVLSASLATWQGLNSLRTLGCLLGTPLLVYLANTGRTTALFYSESGLVQAPPWFHDAIGVMAFLATALAITALHQRTGTTP
ncbi:exosortase/archaeosortase family protein [Chitinivorax tropicus]|uniref:Exosortase/archaeosortase family protein n=1 Tax=Chitinivorax tropicus TaxID=714531 RepID=A0A840MPT2_9PROT|nr:archaeosortase/exosortase family protein [Chitinivorax tropicus]MBB5019047.1 exosortase/archaeosortase family protein [Chitinivorax tropicus]